MPMNKRATMLGTLFFMGCSSQNTPLRIYAAVSITPVVEHLIAEHPLGYSYEINSAGSSTLAQQIAQGAPADIFLSASPQWVDFLSNQSMVQDSWDHLHNRLVLIQSKNTPTPCDLRNPTALSIADWTHVPAGIYAKQALTELQLFSALESRLIPAIHVHAVLNYVARGDIPCGIVYKSDTLLRSDIDIVPSPLDDILLDIRYSFALLIPHKHPKAADFFAWITDSKHNDVYTQFGFIPKENTP